MTVKWRYVRCVNVVLVLGAVVFSPLYAAGPVLFFSDLVNGPKSGWEGSSAKGAAVTVWGGNFGSFRGSSYITVCGAVLENDSDYAEWGITGHANGVVQGLERITFWLNNSCQDGEGTITVTVDDITSNTIPFYIRSGSIYFVSQSDGNDSYNGIYGSFTGEDNGPWRTIPRTDLISPGGIVYIRTGTYSDADGYSSLLCLEENFDGSSNSHCAWIGYPCELPELDGRTAATGGIIRNRPSNVIEYIVLSKMRLLPYSMGTRFDNGSHHIRIAGIEMDGLNVYPEQEVRVGAFGVDVCSYFDILGCHVYDWGHDKFDHGIYVGTYASTQNAEYYDIGWNEFHDLGTDVSGIYIHPRDTDTTVPQKYADEVDIHDNLCYNLEHAGIHISSRVEDIRIFNNIIYNCGSAEGRAPLYLSVTSDHASNILVYNNTIYSAGSSAVVTFLADSNAEMKNNMIFSLSGASYYSEFNYTGAHSSCNDNWFGNGPPPAWAVDSLNSDPLFIDAANHDFRLQPESPCIDAGANVSPVVSSDISGVYRPQGYGFDIGAYEYNMGDVFHLKGDVDGDGAVNIQDVQACINHINNVENWGDAADVNRDRSFDRKDVDDILDVIMK